MKLKQKSNGKAVSGTRLVFPFLLQST